MIVSAEAELHRYSGVHHAAPLRTRPGAAPDGVRESVIDSGVWRLTTRRTEFLRDDQDEAKFWATWRKDSVRWREAIASATASGRIPIPGALERVTPAQPRGGEALVEA